MAVSVNTRYRIEIKWDQTADTYEFKVNGTTYSSGSLTTANQHGALLIGYTSTECRGWTGYFDLIAVDDADWVGEEPAGVSIPVFMRQYKARRQ